LLAAAKAVTRPEDPRPEVLLTTLEHVAIGQAIGALARCDPDIYQRGNVLVRLTVPKRAPARSRITLSGTPTAEPIPTANLRARITQYANVVNLVTKGDRAEKQPAHPTPWLVNGVEAASEYPGIRVLEGVVTSPVLLADGQVLQRPGYHPDSGLLFVPHGDFEPIPDNPSRDDALAALAMLLDLVIDFPFERPEHRSAWLAGLLTALARHAFGGPTPLFLADGNLRGVGKGKLLHSISTIATMREFAVAPYTTDDKELAKTITALVLAGEPYVCFDNVVGYMGGGALDEVLTATEWQGRILGESKQPRIPICTIWYATANNAIIIGDTARRHCPIRLRSFEERPEERTGFKYPDLLGHIRSNRGRLLAAALTILRAYFVAGRPRQSIIPWGSYEEWADLICACIVWLGMPDPGLARKEVTSKTDSDVRALRSLLVGWQELDADREGYTARKAIEKLKSNADSYPMLREALDAFFDLPFGRLPTPNKLGCTLRKFQDRIADGIYFHAEPSHGGVVKWSVREAKQTEATPTKSNVHPNSNDGWDGGDVGHVQPRDKSFPVGDDEPGKYGSRPEPSFIPTIPTIPPAGAKLYFQDAYGRPSSQGESEMWTWEGAPQWYRTDDNAPAGLPETG
jgi:hypothetical protein